MRFEHPWQLSLQTLLLNQDATPFCIGIPAKDLPFPTKVREITDKFDVNIAERCEDLVVNGLLAAGDVRQLISAEGYKFFIIATCDHVNVRPYPFDLIAENLINAIRLYKPRALAVPRFLPCSHWDEMRETLEEALTLNPLPFCAITLCL